MRGSTLKQLAGALAVTLVVVAQWNLRASEPPARRKPSAPRVQQVEPESLKFTSPLLKQRFDAFLAQFDMQKERWQVEPLREWSPRRGTFFYIAAWRRDLKPDADWQPRVIPAMKPKRESSLQLAPLKDNRNIIQKIKFDGTYVPPHNGWSASVTYEIAALDGRHQETVRILFDHNQQHSNELPALKWDFLVPNNSIDAHYRAEKSRIEFVAETLLPNLGYQQQLLSAIANVGRLREAELKLCADLEAKLRDEIEKGEVSFINWTHVRSDNPPREIPLLLKKSLDFTDKDKAALLADGVARINVRRHRWRDNADELHAAVREAFPLLIDWAAKRSEVEPSDD
jgi:hypothetical protein